MKTIDDSIEYTPADLTRVASEHISVAKNKDGAALLTMRDINSYDVRTCLVFLLDAQSGRVPIADKTVFTTLKDKLFRALHPGRGGLTYQAFTRFAPHCDLLAEAAQYHRENFTPAKLGNLAKA